MSDAQNADIAPTGKPLRGFALWRFNRAAVHHYWAALSWRSCNDFRPWYQPAPCIRCAWRDLSGAKRRAKRRYVQELRRRGLTAYRIPPGEVDQ